MIRSFFLFLVLACTPAIAGDSAVDSTGNIDQRGLETPVRKIGASFDVEILPAEWPACRLAALQGLTAFDAWFAASGKSIEVKAMYANLPPMWRDAVRRGALGLAP